MDRNSLTPAMVTYFVSIKWVFIENGLTGQNGLQSFRNCSDQLSRVVVVQAGAFRIGDTAKTRFGDHDSCYESI
uniref:Uncharacterized protein n=1 Tax=Tanacetum cinerariifolium TaxID=118510 RepID=A0A699IJX3_TANCI|nr:hypothetical protein [Tanacetum cinerariifolium]